MALECGITRIRHRILRLPTEKHGTLGGPLLVQKLDPKTRLKPETIVEVGLGMCNNSKCVSILLDAFAVNILIHKS